jgi:hypothetical protein
MREHHGSWVTHQGTPGNRTPRNTRGFWFCSVAVTSWHVALVEGVPKTWHVVAMSRDCASVVVNAVKRRNYTLTICLTAITLPVLFALLFCCPSDFLIPSFCGVSAIYLHNSSSIMNDSISSSSLVAITYHPPSIPFLLLTQPKYTTIIRWTYRFLVALMGEGVASQLDNSQTQKCNI